MTAAWWGHLAEMLDEAAEYLADQERSTADYLSRAAWMVHAISEEEAADERKRFHSGSGSRRGGLSRCWGSGAASGDGTNPAGGHGRPEAGAVAAEAMDGLPKGVGGRPLARSGGSSPAQARSCRARLLVLPSALSG